MNKQDVFTAKIGTSIFLWGFVTIISVVAMGKVDTMPDSYGLVMLGALVVGLLLTAGIWFNEIIGAMFSLRKLDDDKAADEKSKNSAHARKVALLMDLMDDDERAAFKEALRHRMLNSVPVSSDGELNMDAAFFEEDDAYHRR